MVTLADVRRWDPAGVEHAFRALGAARDRLLELDHALRRSRPPDGWRGVAADAARGEQERLAERLRRLLAGIAAVRPTVADAADAVTGVRAGLRAAEELAAAHGFAVGADGTVTDRLVTVVADPEEHRRRRAALRAEIVDRIEQVLRRADETDAALAAVLRRAAADGIDDGAGASLAGAALRGHVTGGLAPTAPPVGGSVGDDAGWWASLSAAERTEVLARHPGWVGNLDGVPAAVRDRANRDLLAAGLARVDREIGAAEAELARLWAAGDLHTAWEMRQLGRRLEDLRAERAPLAAVAATVGAPGDRQLLLLDLAHERPRAAVAVGDVDTADHVAVFTPGFTSTVAGSLDGYDRDMARLVDVTEDSLDRAGRRGETVAAVTWIGYDAPQWSTTFEVLDPFDDDDESVASPDAARAGGADLARFYDGIDAARGTDPHLTALGHSYGSVTTGYALQTAGRVDDAVLFGSPGAGTDDVRDLRVPAGHVAILEADRDPVADLGRFGTDPNQLDGVVNLSSDAAARPGGGGLEGGTGHSAYLSPDGTSQYNIAQTVAGAHDRRIEGDNDGLGDRLRDPSGTLDRVGEWARDTGDDAWDGLRDGVRSLGGPILSPFLR